MPNMKGQNRVVRGYSFRKGQVEALKEMAAQERHGNVSLVLQNLVDEEIERRGMTVPAEAKTAEQKEAA